MAHSNCCENGECRNGDGCNDCPSKKEEGDAEATEEKTIQAMRLPFFGKRRIDIRGNVTEGMERRVNMRLNALLKDGDEPILVPINTYGGDVRVDLGIHEALVNAGPTIYTAVYGMAFSAGSLILQAGDVRLATPNSQVMIHQMSWFECGRKNVNDAEKEARQMRWSEQRLEDIFAARTKLSSDQLRKWFSKDKYMTAVEAVELGFADCILLPRDIEASPVKKSPWRGVTRRVDRLLRGLGGLGAFADMMESIFDQDEDDDDDGDDSASADRPRLHRRR